jgi:hypothetical protein
MDDLGILNVIKDYEKNLQLPTTDVLNYGCQKLVQALSKNFPELKHKITRENYKRLINGKAQVVSHLKEKNEIILAQN